MGSLDTNHGELAISRKLAPQYHTRHCTNVVLPSKKSGVNSVQASWYPMPTAQQNKHPMVSSKCNGPQVARRQVAPCQRGDSHSHRPFLTHSGSDRTRSRRHGRRARGWRRTLTVDTPLQWPNAVRKAGHSHSRSTTARQPHPSLASARAMRTTYGRTTAQALQLEVASLQRRARLTVHSRAWRHRRPAFAGAATGHLHRVREAGTRKRALHLCQVRLSDLVTADYVADALGGVL